MSRDVQGTNDVNVSNIMKFESEVQVSNKILVEIEQFFNWNFNFKLAGKLNLKHDLLESKFNFQVLRILDAS